MTEEIIHQVDSIDVTLNVGGMNTINIVLAFVMFGVALGIFADFPAHGGMLVITAWWGVWHIIGGLLTAVLFNKMGKE